MSEPMSVEKYKWYQMEFSPLGMIPLTRAIKPKYQFHFLTLKHLEGLMKRKGFTVAECQSARDYAIQQWPELVK